MVMKKVMDDALSDYQARLTKADHRIQELETALSGLADASEFTRITSMSALNDLLGCVNRLNDISKALRAIRDITPTVTRHHDEEMD